MNPKIKWIARIITAPVVLILMVSQAIVGTAVYALDPAYNHNAWLRVIDKSTSWMRRLC